MGILYFCNLKETVFVENGCGQDQNGSIDEKGKV